MMKKNKIDCGTHGAVRVFREGQVLSRCRVRFEPCPLRQKRLFILNSLFFSDAHEKHLLSTKIQVYFRRF